MDTNILLESGTNELEVLEFTLGRQSLRNQCRKDQRDFAIYAGHSCSEYSSEC